MSIKEPKIIEFQLTSPVTYHKGGQKEETNILFLKAPSNKQKIASRNLKQIFGRVIKGSEQQSTDNKISSSVGASNEFNNEEDIKEIFNGGAIFFLLLSSKEVNINDCFKELKQLMTTGCAEIDDGINLSLMGYDQINEEDEERLLGEYLSNFLLTSTLKMLGVIDSKEG